MELVVGVGDMKVSDQPEDMIITYSLGSCIGVAIYDPVARVGGLLHYMLPEASLDGNRAKKNPYMFGDTGIPALFKSAYKLGAKKGRMKVAVAGGAQIMDQKGFFNIGKRNYLILRKLFWKNNVMIDYEDVGGTYNRTIKMIISDGSIWIKRGGEGYKRIC